MSSKNRRSLFYLLWLVFVILGPYALFKTVLATSFQNFFTSSFILRLSGVLIFQLLFFQIVLGSKIRWFRQKFGSFVFPFHIFQGMVVYFLILLHTLAVLILNYQLKGVVDPFYVFSDVCLLCPKPIEFYYTLGRLSFWLISLAILAGIFRTRSWWRKNWRKFHWLNYLVFFLIAAHAWFVGSDMISKPFVWFFWFAVVLVGVFFLQKLNQIIKEVK